MKRFAKGFWDGPLLGMLLAAILFVAMGCDSRHEIVGPDPCTTWPDSVVYADDGLRTYWPDWCDR